MPNLFGAFSYTWPIYMVGVAAYGLGSIPFGLLLTRWTGVGDIREIGSGNIGATNVFRTGHKRLALATLILDFSKGIIAVVAAGIYGPDCAVMAGFCAVAGHMFPIWLKFKGGKGVATTFGVIFGFSWVIGILSGLTWIAVVVLFRYSSLGAIVSISVAPVLLTSLLFFQRNGEIPIWLPGQPQHIALFSLLAFLVLVRHYQNIRRLLQGKETAIFNRK